MIIIPFAEFPAFRQSLTLEGVSYIFSFVWNTRDNAWTMSIYDDQNEPLVLGIRIVLNYELIGQYQHLEIPPGKIYALDTTGNVNPITYEDMFNGRISLLYLLEGEELSYV